MINICIEALGNNKVPIIKSDVDNTSSGGGTYYFYVTGYSTGGMSQVVLSAIGLPETVWEMYPMQTDVDKFCILTASRSSNGKNASFSIREVGTFEVTTNIMDYVNQFPHSKSPALVISEADYTSSGSGVYYYYLIGRYTTQVTEGFYFIGTDKDDWSTFSHGAGCYFLRIYRERDKAGESWSDWIINKHSLIEQVPTLDLTSHVSELESFVPTQDEVNAIEVACMFGELKVIIGQSFYKLKLCSEMPTENSRTLKMNNTSIGFDNNKLYISTFITLELTISEENQYTMSVTGLDAPTLTVVDLSSLIS